MPIRRLLTAGLMFFFQQQTPVPNAMWTWTTAATTLTINETHQPNAQGQIALNWTPKDIHATACYLNGLRLVPGYDYVLNSKNISMATSHAPMTSGDILLCDYYH